MKTTLTKTIIAIGMVLILCTPSLAGSVKLKFVISAYRDNEGTGMSSPEGVACADNFFVVTDSGNNRLIRYTYANNSLTPEATSKIKELSYPIALQITTGGDIYVLDGKLLKIARLGQDSTFKGFMSFSGVPGPQEVIPRSFKIEESSGLIYILDIFGGRVLVVDEGGNYKRHIPFPKSYGFFSDLTVNNRGDVLLLDSIQGVLYSASKDAHEFYPLVNDLKEHTRFPTNLTTDRQGNIYIVDHHGGAIIVLGPDGRYQKTQLGFGWKESLLNYPSQVCISKENYLVIADTGNSRVQIFDLVQ
jgi:hypothetical protein